MAKLVSIVWYKIFPAVFGGQRGIDGFLERMSQHFPLTCICSFNNDETSVRPFRIIAQLPTSKTQFLKPRVWRRISRIVKTEEATHVILEHPYHGIAAWRSSRANRASFIVHSHNIESLRFRMLGKWWWRLLQVYERWVHRKADLSLFKTMEDMNWAILHFGLNPASCLHIPYGIQKTEHIPDAARLIRERHGIGAEEKILLFAGTLDYLPNTRAVEAIVASLLPLLKASSIGKYRIIVCGRMHKSKHRFPSSTSLIYAGEVVDIGTYFQAADVFINPVREVAGIQTKNIEALGHHCSVVCFESAAIGIPSHLCGGKLLTVPNGNWDKFVQMTEQALLHTNVTPTEFFDYFDWERITQPVRQWISQDKLQIKRKQA